jgi:signal transduction histidine kinase/ligand-binding sensor domain-containing protein
MSNRFQKKLIVVIAFYFIAMRFISPLYALEQGHGDDAIAHWVFDSTHIIDNVAEDLVDNFDLKINGSCTINDTNNTGSIQLTKKGMMSSFFDASAYFHDGFTFEMWVAITDSSPPFSFLFSLAYRWNNQNWFCGFNRLFLSFRMGNVTLPTMNQFPFLKNRSIIDLGKWNHVVGKFDENQSEIYINGVRENRASLINIQNIYQAKRAVFIVYPNEIVRYHEIRVYNRLLNENEILARYNNKTSLPPPVDLPKDTIAVDSLPPAPGTKRTWNRTDGLDKTYIGYISKGPTKNIAIRIGLNSPFHLFDGYQFKSIPHEIGDICFLYESFDRKIWTLVEGKPAELYIYDSTKIEPEKRWEPYTLDPPVGIYTIVPISAKRGIYLTADQRVMEFDCSLQTSAEILNVTQANCGSYSLDNQTTDSMTLTAGKNKNAWIALEKGLIEIQSNREWKVHRFDQPSRLSNLQIVCIPEEDNVIGQAVIDGEKVDVLFDGQTFQRLTPYQKDRWLPIHIANQDPLIIRQNGKDYRGDNLGVSPNSQRIGQNELWFGGLHGLTRYTSALWQTPYELISHRQLANSILEDTDGSIWVLYRDLLAKFDGETWETFPFSGDITQYYPFTLLPDGKIYIPASQSIFCFDPKTKKYTDVNQLDRTHMAELMPSLQHPNRFGTCDYIQHQFGLFDGTMFEPLLDLKRYNIDPSCVRDFYFAGDKTLWIADLKGLRRFRNGEPAPFEQENAPPFNSTLLFLETQEKKLWIAIPNAIYEYDNGTWIKIKEGLDIVSRIRQMRDGSIWVATYSGLHQYRNGVWMCYTTDEGLPDNNVYGVFEDSQGRIWAATRKGVSVYNPEADRDPPKVILNPELNPNTFLQQESIQFVYSGVDKWRFTKTQRLLYSHRIDQGEWSPFDETTIAVYPNLSAGPHTFSIRAMDRNWNQSKIRSWPFQVILPWYRDPIFILVLGSLLLIILISAILHFRHYFNLEQIVNERTLSLRRTTERLREMASELSLTEERERRQLASDLHDSISQSISLSIMDLSMLLQSESSTNQSNQLKSLKDRMGETLHATQTLTFDLCPSSLYQLGLESAIRQFAEQYQDKYGIEVIFEDDGISKTLSKEIRYFLYRATRELLINIQKYAQAKIVTISISGANNHICICVDDDGIGFDIEILQDSSKRLGGYGLFNIQERLTQIGGRMILHSTPEDGTTVTLLCPLSQNEKKDL